MPAPPEFQQRLQTIERLLGEIESAANPSLRTSVQELVQLVMDLHGAGIGRMLELVAGPEDQRDKVLQQLCRDELVSSLLVLHGLHPMDLAARVTQALDKVRLKVRAHDGEVELLGIQDGSVRLRLQAVGHGCGSTAQTLKEMVENAIYQGAPDIEALIIESAESNQGFVPIEMLRGIAPATHLPNDLVLTASEKGGL